jgi:hypothetical protein
MILRSLDGKFYQIDQSKLEGKEVDPKDIPNLPESLPEPPSSGDVAGHDCHHWYNWHNHHWHDHHWHDHQPHS